MLFALLIFTVKETADNQGISVNMQKIHTPVASSARTEAELCQSFIPAASVSVTVPKSRIMLTLLDICPFPLSQ